MVLIFFPVLDLSGHFINLVEFYIYFLFALNVKKLIPVSTIRIIIVYTVLFFIAVVFTSLMASKPINNYDIFVIRNCAQLICLFSVMYVKIMEISCECKKPEFTQFLINCLYILSLPALLIYFERVNFLNVREVVKVLYKPQFFFLGADMFSEFRYTSVFKDFFTAGVYFIILTSSIYYFYLTASLKKNQRYKIIFLLVAIYLSQLFVSRSSLVLIPINLILMTLFATKAKLLTSVKRLLVIIAVITPILVVTVNSLVSLNYIRGEWVSEGLNILLSQSEETNSSSFAVMQNWNQNFFKYLADHPGMLFVPNHEYDLKESTPGGLYTDGFYPQEIYRYGIYGMLAYLYLVVFLLKDFIKKNRGLFILVITFVLLNYKGGNVFFMPKNIYLYAFIFASFLIWDDCNEHQSIAL